MRFAKIILRARMSRFQLVSAVALAAALAAAAQAQTLSTLWSFSGPDGQNPQATFSLGSDGSFYGTTSQGGVNYPRCSFGGCGTVFKITPSGVLTTLYNFSGPDGGDANALTLGSDGDFYGTTYDGGTNTCSSQGCGTFFTITPSGDLTTLYNFTAKTDGFPNALTLGSDGNFYGTTSGAGCDGSGCGTVFRMTSSGDLTTLYDFSTVDGENPSAALTSGNDGDYYGTTAYGGVINTPSCGGIGCGTIFKITPSGVLTNLHSFTGADGMYPRAPLALGSDGNLYGTTTLGGTYGLGTVFKITASGVLAILYSFSGPDGDEPSAGLILGSDGNFYGTTYAGGAYNDGTIFNIAPDGPGSLSSLYSFGGQNGASPQVALALGNDGNFYGTTYAGGANNAGTVFRWCLPGGAQGCTTTTVTSTANPSTYGGAVTFTATVVPAAGSNTPTGSVSFTDGGTLLNSVTLVAGTASLTTSSLSVGQHVIIASYSGDANFQTSGGILAQTVGQVATNTTLTSNLNPSAYGQSVTFAASVTPTTGAGTPTGKVVFRDGSATLGVVTLTNGYASITPAALLGAGTQPITASYSGDTNDLASSGSLSQVVSQATTTVTLTSNGNPALTNQPVTLTATVTGQYGGGPTGTVTFWSNGVQIGSPVTVASRQASITTSFASAGTFSITAMYSGDPNYLGSSAPPLSETIYMNTAVPTTTSLRSSGSPSTVGKSVTFTATVKPALGSIPNGETVTFYDGTASIGTGMTASGIATFTTSSLAAGTHSITATYAGDGTYSSSTSPVVKQVVNKNKTTTALASSLNPSTYGQSVTFTAIVSSGGPTPTGIVAFKSGAAAIGTGTLSRGMATFAYAKLAAGTSSITAVYGGDAASLGSTSAPVNQSVMQAATTTTVTSSKNPSNQGQSVTFTATVTSTYAVPTGTVTFTQGTTTLGTATLTGGKARLAVTTLPVGSDTVTATYNGTANFVGSSGSVVQTVN